jgi:serine/threonine protein kinase
LVSDTGDALISDFGLSNVIEELSLTDASLRTAQFGTSLLAGSTRWMAPELILTLVEDDGAPPVVTTESDVFSFACVCLEVGHIYVPTRAHCSLHS